MKLRIQGNSLRFRLTRSEVARLHESAIVEDDVGINARDGQMRITIEKDFRCLTRREEDEVDAYPHPVEEASY